MRAFIRNSILIVFLTGCGDPTVLPALASIVANVTEIVKNQTGKVPADIPHECETEYSPEKGEYLLLCTFHVDPDKR